MALFLEQEPSLEEDEHDYDDGDYLDSYLPTDGLQITGEPFLGNEFRVTRHLRNETTTCDFEWVRQFQDGSIKFIKGAKHPTYILTADEPLQFSILGPKGVLQYLCVDLNSIGINCSRDAIVLTMRWFVKQ
ncbi:hypothetical protein Hanom_Chr12g01073621 [Helianthus anomalus]